MDCESASRPEFGSFACLTLIDSAFRSGLGSAFYLFFGSFHQVSENSRVSTSRRGSIRGFGPNGRPELEQGPAAATGSCASCAREYACTLIWQDEMVHSNQPAVVSACTHQVRWVQGSGREEPVYHCVHSRGLCHRRHPGSHANVKPVPRPRTSLLPNRSSSSPIHTSISKRQILSIQRYDARTTTRSLQSCGCCQVYKLSFEFREDVNASAVTQRHHTWKVRAAIMRILAAALLGATHSLAAVRQFQQLAVCSNSKAGASFVRQTALSETRQKAEICN